MVVGPGGLYTVCNTPALGVEPWLLTGAPGGGSVILDINPGPGSSNPGTMVRAGNLVYFMASDGVHGSELWVTNGTAAGTHMVEDITPGPFSTAWNWLAGIGDTLYFTPLAPGVGYELWVSDSTEAGTVMLKDINPGSAHSLPGPVVEFNGAVYFTANNGVNGTEMWTSNGTPGGTMLFKDINPGTAGSNPGVPIVFNGSLVFLADDGTDGAELWSSNGTVPGTSLLKDLEPGAGGSFPNSFKVIGDSLYFTAYSVATGGEPWTSDGTPGGTTMLKDIAPGSSSSGPANFIQTASGVVFQAYDAANGSEPWITDGTGPGTTLLKDINPGASSSNPGGFKEYHGLVYFSATEPVAGTEVWSTDGTPGGTAITADINSGVASSGVNWFVRMGDTLYFTAQTPAYGNEPWYLWTNGGAAIDTIVTSPKSGWNLVSLPVNAADGARSVLFPTSITSAFAWESGVYAAHDTLEPMPGYFLKFPSDTSVELIGTELTQDSVNVNAGWNLMGSISSPVDVGDVLLSAGLTLQSGFYGYNGGYFAASTIEPGQGYWVKANQAGTITLAASGNSPVPRRDPVVDEGVKQDAVAVSTISVIDALGRKGTLSYGAFDVPMLSRFEMPPLPPTGGFDARFRSGRSAEAYPAGGEVAAPIVLTGAVYPVRIEWAAAGDGGALVTSTGRTPLIAKGSLTIDSPDALLSLVLSAGSGTGQGALLPEAYALRGNYPNPFNPSTRIDYDLPVASIVRITVFDILGRAVATVADGIQEAGRKSAAWEAGSLAGGVYYYRLEATPLEKGWSTFTASGRMALIR
jgi:ELWxxDGT repeat protein